MRSHEVDLGSAASPVPRGRGLLVGVVLALVLLGAAVGGVLAWQAERPVEPPPRPAPVVVPSVVTPWRRRRCASEVQSEPSGAVVVREGVQIGVTPFVLTVPRTDEQPVQVELAFSLEGYLPSSVVAGAQGGDGAAAAATRAARRAGRARAARGAQAAAQRPEKGAKPPTGYKDDRDPEPRRRASVPSAERPRRRASATAALPR